METKRTIINVTVNKDEKTIDDENDETVSSEIDASEPLDGFRESAVRF